MSEVHIGFFENFKSSDTVLIEGDDDGLRQLVRVFRSLSAAETQEVALEGLDFARRHGGIRLKAIRDANDRGIVGRSPEDLAWKLTADGWNNAAELSMVLIVCSSGHQYFQNGQSRVVVQVSRGEYGHEWWKRHE